MRINHFIRIGLLSAALILYASVFAPPANAHPHAFVVNQLTFVFDADGLAGIHVKWGFDEMFTAMMAEDFDTNGDGAFNPEEVVGLKKGAFDNLSEYGFFTHIHIDNKRFDVKFIKNFHAVLQANGQMIYEFLVPCHVKVGKRPKTIRLSQYDPTFYTAILFDEQTPVRLQDAKAFNVTHKIAENPDETYYYGTMHPTEIILNFTDFP